MSAIIVAGDTSGTVTLQAQAVAGTTTLTLPATSGTVVTKDTNGIISVNGVQFPATQSASADANCLDDYEEGTWTPSIGGTATYKGRSGRYTKIGDVVNAFCVVNVNLIGTGSTTLVSGLPFVSAGRSQGSMGFFASLANSVVFLSPIAEGSTIAFLGTTASATTATDGIAIFKNDAYVIFSITYFV
jgi:hypothetical protein